MNSQVPIHIDRRLTPLSQARAMYSVISNFLSRAKFARGGTAFDGNRDYYQTFGYKRDLTFNDYMFKYKRQDVARRIIDQPVDGTWTDAPTVWSESPEFDAAWQDLVAEVKLYYHLANVDRLAGLGRYAILLIGYDDGANVALPIRPKSGRKIVYLQPYGEGSVKVSQYDENPSSPRFGKPVLYEVTPGDTEDVSASSLVSIAVKRTAFFAHYTRVLHVAEGALQDQILGHPRMEPCYNLLDDLIKVVGGSAETFWLTANRGLQIDIDKEVEMDAEDEQNMADEIDEYEHGLRRVLRTRGVKVTNIGSDVPNPDGTFKMLISLLAAVTGIPQRMLLGAEAGQLASEQDRAQWAARINERAVNYAEPTILLPLISSCVWSGVLPDPGLIDVEWPEAFKLNPLERGQASAQMARSAGNLVRARNESLYPPGAVNVRSQDITQETAEKTAEATAKAAEETAKAAKENPKPAPRAQAEGDTDNVNEDKGTETTSTDREIQTLGEEVLSIEEVRSIIGFGKRPPVLDADADSSGATKAKPTAKAQMRGLRKLPTFHG